MIKSLLGLLCLLISISSYATETVRFQQQDIDHLFTQYQQTKQKHRTATPRQQEAANPAPKLAKMTPRATLKDTEVQFLKTHYNPKTKKSISTYQQHFHGIPVLGGKITVQHKGKFTQSTNPLLSKQPIGSRLSGRYIANIDLDPDMITLWQDKAIQQDTFTQVIDLFQQSLSTDFFTITPVDINLVISVFQKQAHYSYQMRFYQQSETQPKRLVTLLVDADNPGIIYQVYDNLQHYGTKDEIGPGGNTKTGKYYYGEEGIPALTTQRINNQCLLRNKNITVINALESPDNENYHRVFAYRCGDQRKDEHCHCTDNPWWLTLLQEIEPIKMSLAQDENKINDWIKQTNDTNDIALARLYRTWLLDPRSLKTLLADKTEFCYCAYSAGNDAFYFGQVVSDLFKQWYQTDILSKKLKLRVHVYDTDYYAETGKRVYANAYWNPANYTMNFGEGYLDEMYPLVTLDITGHEIAHGFTQEHSALAYLDQSGSLNEAFSDMAGMASLAYLRETAPVLYHKLYKTDEMVWSIGPSVAVTPWDHTDQSDTVPLSYHFPVRYTEKPSEDGNSADCYHQVEGCAITYDAMKNAALLYAQAEAKYTCEDDIIELCAIMIANGRIVHWGSGVFNKAFYQLANKNNWSVRKAFEVMLTANRDGYWVDPDASEQAYFFEDAACATLMATQDLGYEVDDVRDAFQQAGLLLSHQACQLTDNDAVS